MQILIRRRWRRKKIEVGVEDEEREEEVMESIRMIGHQSKA